MAGIQTNQVAYTETQPLSTIPLLPIVAKRDPSVNDKAPIGSLWVNKLTNEAWILTSIANNEAHWSQTINPDAVVVSYAIQTNNNVPTALISIPVGMNEALNITGSIMAASAGYLNALGGRFTASFLRGAGALALVGAAQIDTADTTGGAVLIDIVANGNSAELQVTGQAATVWNWNASTINITIP